MSPAKDAGEIIVMAFVPFADASKSSIFPALLEFPILSSSIFLFESTSMALLAVTVPAAVSYTHLTLPTILLV